MAHGDQFWFKLKSPGLFGHHWRSFKGLGAAAFVFIVAESNKKKSLFVYFFDSDYMLGLIPTILERTKAEKNQ